MKPRTLFDIALLSYAVGFAVRGLFGLEVSVTWIAWTLIAAVYLISAATPER